MIRSLIIFILVLLLALPSFACRPLTYIDDTGTVYRGEWEIEGYVDSQTVSSVTTTSLGGIAKYGIIKNLEGCIGLSYQSTAGTSGRGPMLIGGKYRFNEEEGSTPSFGIAGSIGIPESGDSEINIRGLLTDTLKDFTYHINLSLTSIGSISSLMFGGAIEHPVNNDFNIVGELISGSMPLGGASLSILGGSIGGKWQIKNNMILDSALKFGLNSNTPNGFTVGIVAGI